MSYDAVVVGGGLAGSALADQLARSGHRVLVLERETKFKDRVRGENMMPWGVSAAQRLGFLDDLLAARGHRAPHWRVYAMGNALPPRDLRSTTPDGQTMLNMFHPDLQETLIARASASGATVLRGATVLGLDAGPGRSPSVTFEHNGTTQTVSARIVVGADGRASQMRGWAGFEVQRNPDLLTIAGTLLEGTSIPDDAAHFCIGAGIATFWAPLGNKRSRTYFVYPGVAGRRGLSGKHKVAEFLQAVQSAASRRSGSTVPSLLVRSQSSRARTGGSRLRQSMASCSLAMRRRPRIRRGDRDSRSHCSMWSTSRTRFGRTATGMSRSSNTHQNTTNTTVRCIASSTGGHSWYGRLVPRQTSDVVASSRASSRIRPDFPTLLALDHSAQAMSRRGV